MTAPRARVDLRIQVDGSDLPPDAAERLTAAVVDDERNLPDLCLLVFDDQAQTILDHFDVGKALTVSVASEHETGGEAIFDGEITALEVEIEAGAREAVVRAYDKTHRLQRGTHTQTYLDMTYSDVAKAIAQRRGLRIGDTGDNTVVHPAVVQWNQSDWDFLSQLAAEIGHEVVVGDGKIDFKVPASADGAPGESTPDQAGARQLVAANIRRLRASVNAAEQVEQVEVRGWDPVTKREVTATSNARRASTHRAGADPAQLGSVFGTATLVRTHLPVESVELASSAADSLMEQLGSVAAEVEGIVEGDPSLRAGVSISLSGLGTKFDGDFSLTSCRHEITQADGYVTHFRVSGRQDRTLLGLTRAEDAARSGGGLVPAVVSDLDDPEARGRVKVSFPWLHESVESPWARVCGPGGGKERGIVWYPEVGDEVLVGFDHGDVRRPYILGGLWNGTDVLPTEPGAVVGQGTIDTRTMVSRTGSHLTFDDSDGSIRMVSGDQKLSLLMEAGDTSVTIKSDGTVSIETSQELAINAGTDLKIEASANVEIKAGASLTLEGGSDAALKAPMVEVNGSGQTTVKGGLVQIN